MFFVLMHSLFPCMGNNLFICSFYVQFFASVVVGIKEGYFTANQKILVNSDTKLVGKSRSISLPLTYRLA